MWLKSIKLKDFKRFSDFQVQFGPKINVVKGSLNEIGKSTLLEGIIAALFYNPKSTAKWLEDYISWGSNKWYQTSLEFEEEGDRYLLEKDFGKGAIKLVGYDTAEEFDTFKEVSERIEELLGAKSDRLFLCTSCILQDQVSEISSGKKEIGDSLEEVVTGGEENILASQVIQKLDNKISEIKRGLDRPAKFLGTLADLKSKIEDTSQRHKEVKNEVSKVETQKIELTELAKELIQIKEEYEQASALLEKNKQRREIEASIKNLTKDYNKMDKLLWGISSLVAESKRANEALSSIEGLESEQQLSEFRRRLDAIQIRRGDIGKDLDKRGKEVIEAKEKLDKRKSLRFLSSGRSTAAAAIIFTGGIVGTLAGSLYLLSLIILGMALLGASIWARCVLVRDRTKISSLEERVQKMKETLRELGEEQKEILAEAKCSTIDKFDEREEDFNHWLEEKGKLENQLVGKLGGRTIEEIEKQRLEIARDLAVEQAKLTEDLKATALSPEKYVELEGKVENLKGKQAALDDRKKDCEAIIKWARFDAEDQIKLEEELESLGEALRREENRAKVYELAKEFISRARAEAFLSANEVLEREIQKHFLVFTNGKYDQVKVGKENLEFWVYSEEKSDWAKPEELSGGVIDEFYLACRLALVKLIFGDKKPPLILDDPFGNFDPIRLAKTLDFFKKLADDYQIIIFTLKDLYDEVADNIISLD